MRDIDTDEISRNSNYSTRKYGDQTEIRLKR